MWWLFIIKFEGHAKHDRFKKKDGAGGIEVVVLADIFQTTTITDLDSWSPEDLSNRLNGSSDYSSSAFINTIYIFFYQIPEKRYFHQPQLYLVAT